MNKFCAIFYYLIALVWAFKGNSELFGAFMIIGTLYNVTDQIIDVKKG